MHSPTHNLLSLCLSASTLLLTGLGCNLPKDQTATNKENSVAQSTPTPEQASKKTEKAPTASPSPSAAETGVTMANYSKLKTGMTYSEVVKVLGKDGEELSSNEIGGYRNVMYKWDGDSGSWGANMNAMFQNGKLIQKSQFGLK